MPGNTTATNDSNGSPAPQSGTMCWLEIPATDIARVAAFYAAVLGWTCYQPTVEQGTPSPLDPNLTVHMFTHAGTLNGAFVRMPDVLSVADASDKKKVGVLTSFKVEDLEATLNTVLERGGKVHVPKTAIGGNRGYFARFIDSEGNLQGLWAMNG